MTRQYTAVARDRALMRLRDLHPQEYRELYTEELLALANEREER